MTGGLSGVPFSGFPLDLWGPAPRPRLCSRRRASPVADAQAVRGGASEPTGPPRRARRVRETGGPGRRTLGLGSRRVRAAGARPQALPPHPAPSVLGLMLRVPRPPASLLPATRTGHACPRPWPFRPGKGPYPRPRGRAEGGPSRSGGVSFGTGGAAQRPRGTQRAGQGRRLNNCDARESGRARGGGAGGAARRRDIVRYHADAGVPAPRSQAEVGGTPYPTCSIAEGSKRDPNGGEAAGRQSGRSRRAAELGPHGKGRHPCPRLPPRRADPPLAPQPQASTRAGVGWAEGPSVGGRRTERSATQKHRLCSARETFATVNKTALQSTRGLPTPKKKREEKRGFDARTSVVAGGV